MRRGKITFTKQRELSNLRQLLLVCHPRDLKHANPLFFVRMELYAFIPCACRSVGHLTCQTGSENQRRACAHTVLWGVAPRHAHVIRVDQSVLAKGTEGAASA